MPDAVLDALRAAAGPDVRPAGPADAVAGVQPAYVAAPADTAETAALLRAAADHELAVTVRGGGTRQDWAAAPRRLDLVISTARLTGVVEHAAGDLIAVVRAGTPMTELADALGRAGQRLALDPPDPDNPGATIGGTVALNSSGPLRVLYGTVRDLLIGVTMVRADGVVAHAGGKVVKNVAGYDLGKLLTGSYGTLGLITECAFRLHPVPATAGWVSRRVDTPAAAGRLVAGVLGGQLVPAAIEVDAPPGGDIEVAVLLEGTELGVQRRTAAAAGLLGGDAAAERRAPRWWGRHPWPPGGVGLKLTAALSGVPELLAAARAAGDRHGLPVTLRGSAGAGVLYAGLPAPAADPAGPNRPGDYPTVVGEIVDELRGAAREAGGHAVVLTAPAEVRDRIDLWGPVPGLALMRRVKEQFDPAARLAPGRFVGGI
ncbi:FAD-binding oxidoreductase [Solwaraspora sp. WMMD1047]|uniref:FAD-binding oxidoreductase n=1 Tax=Solwaraspora sp. WMMD1047 TaxID=3016102 RepID=UPI0024171FED|nr:FAD-binding oxidoreductase [Solwaraspora sp. WMMD1047]MDG4829141.1 FAD-binding oxidoreductase [Solwaraspora sp. WMMD1047]